VLSSPIGDGDVPGMSTGASGAPGDGPIDSLAPVNDRLTTTLFLAALFHGIVIIGVSFNIPNPFKARPVPTIEVLLIGAEGDRAVENPEAQYLADRTQKGAGTTEERVRPASPESSMMPVESVGTPEGDGLERRDPTEAPAVSEVLTSRADESTLAVRSGLDEPAPVEESPIALSASAPQQFATNTTDAALALRGHKPRELLIAADTRESRVAPYLDAWKRKTERIGTLNYPRAARRRGLKGNPVLEVAIRADGSLEEIRVVRSSGHREIDQAALGILKLAAPFDPFPADLRTQYDVLRFAYEWQFLSEGSSGELRMGSSGG
jgi:periplasmic protein TonB